MGIEFLWHTHILELRSILTDAEARCFMCHLPVSAYNYRCDKCSFFLHISCLKLPFEATHPAHQEHPLTLLEAPQPIVDGQEVLCNDCGSPSSGFTYHCEACQFNLHLDCAVRRQAFKREVHKHPLTFLASPPNHSENFRCKVCGEIGYGFCLHCGSCQYVVHVECSVFPATISTKRHEHQFTLTQTNSIEGNSVEAYCDVCEEEANLEGSLYYCESCNYSAHLGCVISAPNPHVKFSYKDAKYSPTEALDRQEVESSETNLNFGIQFGQTDDDALVQLRHWFKEHRMVEFGSTSCTNSVSVSHTQNESSTDDSKLLQAGQRHNEASFEGYDIGELPSNFSHVKQLGNVVKLEHFSHQHPLILNDEHKGEVNCFGCLRSISSLVYSCNQCNYFLHEWCAMLPRDIKHPLHPYHTLTLLKRAPDFFGCEACKISCDNFTYKCRVCSFRLHLECASIPRTIKSEVHQHLLTLRPRRENFTGCMACGEDYIIATFQCDECSTKVDFPCALLPHKVRHKCHVHPLTLKYSHFEDDSDEFYCDFCEERRDPNLWIYYCEECDYIAHTKCLTAELFEYVQSRGLIQHDHHKHILNLIMNSPTAP